RDLIRQVATDHDHVLVEGAGGVTVRLGTAFTLLDLADVVRADNLETAWYVVVRAGPGPLNHSSLTTQAIQSRRTNIAGLIIGSWPATPDLAERHNRDDLPSYTGVPVIGAIPAGAGQLDPAGFQADAPGWLPGLMAPTT